MGRIIYLGGLGETGPDLSEHLSSRREVESALASTGVPVTVLRAAMIIGSGSASFEILRYLVERLPVMITPKWVSTPCQPIAVRNVIGYLAGVLAVPETAGAVFDIGGPEALRYSDIMRIMAEELGLKRRWIIPVPVLTPRLSSYWIHLVTPLSHDIAKPLAEGSEEPGGVPGGADQATDSAGTAERAGGDPGGVVAGWRSTGWRRTGRWPGRSRATRIGREGRCSATRASRLVEAPDWAVFRAVCRVGGGHGWYAADWLWRIRGWMDRLVGGPGLRRGRRDPEMVELWRGLRFLARGGLRAGPAARR